MSTISTVIFLKNTQMSRENSIAFDFYELSERTAWIGKFTSVSVPAKIKDYNSTIAINVSTALISAADSTNFDYAYLTDYTGRSYFFYITACKYLTDGVYSYILSIDTFMTYHSIRDIVTYLPSMIERQHYNRYNYTLNIPMFSLTKEPFSDFKKDITRTYLNQSEDPTNIKYYIDKWFIIYSRKVVDEIETINQLITFNWKSGISGWNVTFGTGSATIFSLPSFSDDPNILLIEKLPDTPDFDSITISTGTSTIHLTKNAWTADTYIRVNAPRQLGYNIPFKGVPISSEIGAIFPVNSAYAYSAVTNAYNWQKESKIYCSQFTTARVEYGSNSFYVNREEYAENTLPSSITSLKLSDFSSISFFKVNTAPKYHGYVYDYLPVVSSTIPIFNSEYLAYMRTREANLAIRNTSTALTIGLSAISIIGGIALSASGVGAPAGAAAIFSGVTALSGQIASASISAAQERQKVKDLEIQGRATISQVSGSTGAEETTNINRYAFVSEIVNIADMQSLAWIFHVTGYYSGRYEHPNISSRYSFNTIKGDIEYIMPDNSQIPQAHNNDLKERYRNGIVIIHYHDQVASWSALNSYYRVIQLCNKEV